MICKSRPDHVPSPRVWLLLKRRDAMVLEICIIRLARYKGVYVINSVFRVLQILQCSKFTGAPQDFENQFSCFWFWCAKWQFCNLITLQRSKTPSTLVKYVFNNLISTSIIYFIILALILISWTKIDEYTWISRALLVISASDISISRLTMFGLNWRFRRPVGLRSKDRKPESQPETVSPVRFNVFIQNAYLYSIKHF